MTDFIVSSSMLMMPRKLPHSAWLGHIPFAGWLLESLRPRTIVELGTHNGASFLALCQAVETQQLSSRVYAVDTWTGDEHAGFYGNEVYAELRDYQQRHYAGISEMLRMRFDLALEYFADGSIDLLHIDGLHTYEAVREDFESWVPKLSSRAVVLFHDTCVREREFGVWRYWSEISSAYPSFEFTHTHGLGVLLVGPEQPENLLRLAEAAEAGVFATINHLFDALGRNIKNVEEIERVNAGLVAAHSEISRLCQVEQRLLNEQSGSQEAKEHVLKEASRLREDEMKLREAEDRLRVEEGRVREAESLLRMQEERLNEDEARLREGEQKLSTEHGRISEEEQRLRKWEQRLIEDVLQFRGNEHRLRERESQLFEVEQRLREKEAEIWDAERVFRLSQQEMADADDVRYAGLEAELPKIVLSLSALEQKMSESLDETRQIVAESRELSVASVVDAVLPRLEEQNAKFEHLLRPWWRRRSSR